MLMKRIIYALLIVVSIQTISCKKALKDVKDYYPEIKTISATVLPDGKVEVIGEFISEGGAPVEYAGFCGNDSIIVPKMLNNQLIATKQGDRFSAIYEGLNTNKRYYFRSWAANEYGYSYGNVVYVDSIKPAYIKAPCSPTVNTINIGGNTPTERYSNIGSPEGSGLNWTFRAQSNSYVVDFEFAKKPVTKTYTTILYTPSSSSPQDEDKVHVTFRGGSISASLNEGSPIYINQLSEGKWEIIICDAPWQFSSNSSTNLYFTTQFKCPL